MWQAPAATFSQLCACPAESPRDSVLKDRQRLDLIESAVLGLVLLQKGAVGRKLRGQKGPYGILQTQPTGRNHSA